MRTATQTQFRRIARTLAVVVSIGFLAGSVDAAPIQRVLITDGGNERVLEFELDGTFVGTFASGSTFNGIKQGPNGNIFIADHTSGGDIKEFTVEGTELSPAFDNPNSNLRPDDIAFDSNGNLFFANPFGSDSEADNIYRVDGTSSATAVVTTNFNPRGIAFNGSGNLLVADRDNGRLLEFDPSTGNLLDEVITGQNQIQMPHFEDGRTFFTLRDDNPNISVREIDDAGTVVTSVEADDNFVGDAFLLPNGDLLFMDIDGDRVMRVSDLGGTNTLSTFASGTFDELDLTSPGFGTVFTIPEPTTLVLLGLGMVSLLCRRRRRG